MFPDSVPKSYTMDESTGLANKSLSRCLDPVKKIGYMDGADDGQNAAFQTSFDLAYQQGYNLGFSLGVNDAIKKSQNKTSTSYNKSINCQVCEGNTTLQLCVDNLHQEQIKKNCNYVNKINHT